jgi:3-oxoacyl-[acyl-carrier protein] reductase
MIFRFDNKKVLVTGGTRGIGYEIAMNFMHLGAIVIVTGTSKERPSQIDNQILYEQLSIDKTNDWQNQIKDIIYRYNGFDILINNAGINKVNKINQTLSEDIDNVLLTNLNAPIYIVSEVSKMMIKNKYGYIINIGSIFGVVSKLGRNSYTASKAGLIGVTKTMAIDLAEYSILVNCVSPGFVDTELTRRVLGLDGMKEMSVKIPMHKLAKVSDISSIVLFLSSNYNTYITGQNIIVDGGFTLE